MAIVKKSKVDEEAQVLLDTLAAVGGRLTAEEDVLFEGKKLVIPETLTMHDAIKFLADKIEEEEKEMNFSRTYKFRPWDGAHATMSALKRVFGMVQQKGVRSMFGTTPPALQTINVGYNKTAQVPWGNLTVPMMPGVMFRVGAEKHKELGLLFQIVANGPRKYRYQIEGVFRLIQEELDNSSIYRGQAFDGQEQPDFLDTVGFDPTRVIYSKEVLEQLNANVWTLIRHSQVCRDQGIPLKRATLFEGPYGTGKTLGAYLTAKIAVENGWTFLYCRPNRDNLADVMATARLYQPAVVFFEDVDNVAEGVTASGKDTVSELLDIFDGITAKGTEIMVVLTTNHAERIHKGMVRPGRLDAVITIGAPDADGVRRFIQTSVDEKLLDAAIDYDAVGEAMKGFLPAFITEAIDRAKRYNISNNDGVPSLLGTADFVQSATGLRPQLKLMDDAPETPPADSLDVVFNDRITQATQDVLSRTAVLGIVQSPNVTLVPEGVKDGEVTVEA